MPEWLSNYKKNIYYNHSNASRFLYGAIRQTNGEVVPRLKYEVKTQKTWTALVGQMFQRRAFASNYDTITRRGIASWICGGAYALLPPDCLERYVNDKQIATFKQEYSHVTLGKVLVEVVFFRLHYLNQEWVAKTARENPNFRKAVELGLPMAEALLKLVGTSAGGDLQQHGQLTGAEAHDVDVAADGLVDGGTRLAHAALGKMKPLPAAATKLLGTPPGGTRTLPNPFVREKADSGYSLTGWSHRSEGNPLPAFVGNIYVSLVQVTPLFAVFGDSRSPGLMTHVSVGYKSVLHIRNPATDGESWYQGWYTAIIEETSKGVGDFLMRQGFAGTETAWLCEGGDITAATRWWRMSAYNQLFRDNEWTAPGFGDKQRRPKIPRVQ